MGVGGSLQIGHAKVRWHDIEVNWEGVHRSSLRSHGKSDGSARRTQLQTKLDARELKCEAVGLDLTRWHEYKFAGLVLEGREMDLASSDLWRRGTSLEGEEAGVRLVRERAHGRGLGVSFRECSPKRNECIGCSHTCIMNDPIDHLLA